MMRSDLTRDPQPDERRRYRVLTYGLDGVALTFPVVDVRTLERAHEVAYAWAPRFADVRVFDLVTAQRVFSIASVVAPTAVPQ